MNSKPSLYSDSEHSIWVFPIQHIFYYHITTHWKLKILQALLQEQTQFLWPHFFIFNLNFFLGNLPFALNYPLQPITRKLCSRREFCICKFWEVILVEKERKQYKLFSNPKLVFQREFSLRKGYILIISLFQGQLQENTFFCTLSNHYRAARIPGEKDELRMLIWIQCVQPSQVALCACQNSDFLWFSVAKGHSIST